MCRQVSDKVRAEFRANFYNLDVEIRKERCNDSLSVRNMRLILESNTKEEHRTSNSKRRQK
jgi:hypothetical protein